jgi:hypothetical protein
VRGTRQNIARRLGRAPVRAAGVREVSGEETAGRVAWWCRAMGIVALAVVARWARLAGVAQHEEVADGNGEPRRGTVRLRADRHGTQERVRWSFEPSISVVGRGPATKASSNRASCCQIASVVSPRVCASGPWLPPCWSSSKTGHFTSYILRTHHELATGELLADGSGNRIEVDL